MKTILVTGANKGIGFQIVKKLLKDFNNTHLFLGSRNIQLGEEAVNKILDELGEDIKTRVELVQIDVTDDKSIQAAVDKVTNSPGGLFGLINNAGGVASTHRETLALNTYGAVRVSKAFLPLLHKNGRIVNISSATSTIFVSKCRDDVQNLFKHSTSFKEELETGIIEPFLKIVEEKGIEDKAAALDNIGLTDFELICPGYGLSKAALNVFTRDLAKMNPHLQVNACCPGFVDSDLSRGVMERNKVTPEQMGMKPTESGAVAPVFLMMEQMTGSGDFYGEGGKHLLDSDSQGGEVRGLDNDSHTHLKQT